MKSLGVVFTIVGAVLGVFQFRRQAVTEIRLGRALLCDLAVLKREICISRRTLPSICIGFGNSASGQAFWGPLRVALEERKMPVRQCWESITGQLPDALAVRLAPLGALLGDGGAVLAKAIDEVREEILGDLGDAERNLVLSLRLVGAVCFSGAFFLILMLY